MSSSKRRFAYFPRRQKSFDYYSSEELDGENGNRPYALHRLKSIDEKDSTDLERSATHLDRSVDKNSRVKPNLSDGIKIAAIYNDEAEIIKILSSLSSMANGELRLLTSYTLCFFSYSSSVCLFNLFKTYVLCPLFKM